MTHNYCFQSNSRTNGLGVLLWLLFVCPQLLAQPVLVKSVTPFVSGGDPTTLADVNGTLFFVERIPSGYALWKSQGTEATTVKVKDFAAALSQLTNVNGTLYFRANDPQTGTELWKSNGTTEGTVLVKDIDPGFSTIDGVTRPNGSVPNLLTNVNGTLYFVDFASTLWKSDGTAAGTVPVKEGVKATDLTALKGMLYFLSRNASRVLELNKSDGTAGGTELVKQLNSFPDVHVFTSHRDSLYIVLSTITRDGPMTNFYRPYYLFKSDGTAQGTSSTGLLLARDQQGSNLTGHAFLSNALYFSILSSIGPHRLYRSSPIGAPGVQVADLIGSDWKTRSTARPFLTPLNGSVYFTGYSPDSGYELWKIDNTQTTGTRVTDLNPGPGDATPSGTTAVQGKLYFAADDGSGMRKLWMYDPAPVSATTLRLNAGGNTYTATNGNVFNADGSFTGGSTFSVSSEIANTTSDPLYQSERYGNFSYAIPVSNGNYQVTLHFAEIWWGTPQAGTGGAGSRKFNVDVEGQRKLTEYDIFARAGGALRAVQEGFVVSVTDGVLNLSFAGGSADQAKVSAIEVVPATSSAGFNGYYTLKARHSGKLLDIPAASLEDGVSPIQYSAYQPAAGNQTWLVEPTADGYYTLTARHSGKLLDLPGASLEDGVSPIQYTANTPVSTNQQWKIEPVGDGYYKIVARHSGKVLDVAGASLEEGAQVIQYADFAATAHNQQWQLEPVTASGRLAVSGSKAAGPESWQVKLYPNPVQDRLTVALPFAASQVRATTITDLTGKQYQHNAHKVGDGQQLDFEVGSLRPGLYLLRVQAGNQHKVLKFSKR